MNALTVCTSARGIWRIGEADARRWCQAMEPGNGVSVGASDSTPTAGIVMPAVGVYRRRYATGGVRRFVDGVAW